MSEIRNKNEKSATPSEVENQPGSGVSRRKFLAGSAMALGAAGLSLSATTPARAARAMRLTSGWARSRPLPSGSMDGKGSKRQARHSV